MGVGLMKQRGQPVMVLPSANTNQMLAGLVGDELEFVLVGDGFILF